MAHTLSSTVAEVRNILNETTASFWADDELAGWIKEGVRNFSSKTLMIEDTQDIDPMIAGQLKYTSSDETWLSGMVETYSVLYENGSGRYKGLIKVHPRQIGNLATQTAGAPKYYCMHNRELYIMPMTSAAVVAAGASLSVLFSKVSDDITLLLDEYHHLPVIYAAAKAKQKDQKFAEASSLFQQFYQEVNFERQDKHAREVDSLDKFRIPAKGGGTEGRAG
jgi:hypothetical protein